MPPQLQLVAEENEPVLAIFRAEAGPRLCWAALCAAGAFAFMSLGYQRAVPPLWAGPLSAALIFSAAFSLAASLERRRLRFTLTDRHLAIESGLWRKRRRRIELARVRQVELTQSLLQRMRGAGSIAVAVDGRPLLLLGPLPRAQPISALLRDAVSAAGGLSPAPASNRR